MSEERIIISVREDGSRVVARNLRDIGDQSRRSRQDVLSLTGALQGIGGALALGQVRKWLDVWTSARGKVNIFASSVQEAGMVLDRLVGVAQDARQPLDATINSFHQMSLAASSLGASQEELLNVTSTVNKVFAIQGTTAQTARGGIIQFGQAMTEGIVRAQEYNSMINAMPLVLVTVAKHLEGAGGSVANLRKMMLEGKLTSKLFFEALKAGQADVEALFQKSGKTIGQGFTILENAIIQYLGKLDEATGFSRTLFELMKFGADNINLVAIALTAVTSPVILSGLASVTAALRGMLIALAANPIFLIAGAVAAATVALATYKDEIMVLQDEQLALGDYMNATWSMVKDGVSTAASAIATILSPAVAAVGDSFGGLNLSWAGFVQFIKNGINQLIGIFVGFGKSIGATFALIPGAMTNNFKIAFNAITSMAQTSLNSMITGLNSFLAAAKLPEISKLQFAQMEANGVETFANLGSEIKTIMTESFNTDYIGAGFDTLTEKARVFGEQRKKDLAEELKTQKELGELLKQPKGPGDDFAPTGKSTKGAAGEFDNPRNLENNLRRLLNTIQPMSGAVLEHARAQKILNAALAEGTITGSQHIKYLELVESHYRDIVDPIGAANRELDKELQLLKMLPEQRKIEQQAMQIQQDLLKNGIDLSQQEITLFREKLTLIQQTNAVSQQEAALLSQGAGARQQFIDQMKAMENLRANPASGFTQGDQDTAVTGMLQGMGVDTANFQTSLDAQLAQYDTYVGQLKVLNDKRLISDQEYAAASMQVELSRQNVYLNSANSFFGNLASLQKSGNKKMAAVGKAAAIAQAMISTYQSATSAYAAMAGIPYVGPVLGAAAAGAAIVAGLANVQQIRSQSAGFKSGGYTGSMGQNEIAGNVHGQEFVMNAKATSRVGVADLQALQLGTATVERKGAAGGDQASNRAPSSAPASAGGQQVNQRIINVIDPAMVGDFMATPEGEQVLINTLRRNGDTIRQITGG